MEPSLYEWQMSQNRRIEEKLVQDIYINCFGSEDEFFLNHLANLSQTHERETNCSNINCPTKEKIERKSYLSFKYVLVILQNSNAFFTLFNYQLTKFTIQKILKNQDKILYYRLFEIRNKKYVKILSPRLLMFQNAFQTCS
jgi:hypothetical protein